MSTANTIGELIALKSKMQNVWVGIFFFILLLVGLVLYKDYGVSADEMTQRTIGLTSLAYLANLFNIRFLLGDAQPLADPSSVFLAQRDRDYGVAFELPAEFLIKVLGLQDANAYFFRHLLTFLVFYAAIFFFYKLKTVHAY